MDNFHIPTTYAKAVIADDKSKIKNKMGTTIKIPVSELRDIVYGDSDEYETISSETTGHWRHGSEETTIVKRVSDGKFFEINWRDSVKDECMFSDMNDDGEYNEVFPVKSETIIYKSEPSPEPKKAKEKQPKQQPMELQTTNVGIEKFEQLQKSVNDQVSVLSSIEVTDETSLAVANQQLSKTKQITNLIETAREELKAPYFQAGKQIDKLAKELAVPLTTGIDAVKTKILTYNKAEQARKALELAEIAKAQQKIENDRLAAQAKENENSMLLQIHVTKFEADAFKAVNEAKTMEELSAAFVKYVQEMPKEYGAVVESRIRSLGTAKSKLIQAPETGQAKFDAQTTYNTTYATVTGTEVKIAPKVIEAPVEAVSFLAQQEQAIAIQSTPTNVRKTWAYEVQNICDVPLEWLMVDPDMVKDFMKTDKESLSEGMVYNGIKFFQKETIVIK